MSNRPRDPREIITPDAFTVLPELLGIGLARPSRRLVAIAIDGLLIAILSRVGGTMLLALGVAGILWRSARRDPKKAAAGAPQQRSVLRVGLRVASLIAFIVFLVAAGDWIMDRNKGDNGSKADAAARSTRDDGDNDDVDFDANNIDLKDLGLGISDMNIMPVMMSYSKAGDSASAAAHADSIARWISRKPDSMHTRLAVAMVDVFGDTPGSAALRSSLRAYIPTDTVSGTRALERQNEKLERQVRALRNDKKELEKQIETEKKGFTVKKMLNSLSDVLGFGFGWSALYFTALTMLMKGQTPGKKLLGIRVIRLDGQPITGWLAFERFGGYAASAAIGLLGFAQILWDRNRQALHDKATETVVIREKNGIPTRPFDMDGRVNPFRAAPAPPPPPDHPSGFRV